MEDKYPPFEIQLPNFNNQFVFYDNPDLLNYSGYYSLCFVLFIFLCLFVVFVLAFCVPLKSLDESMLWAGLAKRQAHQIGTPLFYDWLDFEIGET